jgi:hypothetical protein
LALVGNMNWDSSGLLSALFLSFFRIKSETLTAVNNLLFAVVRVHQTSIASAIAFKLRVYMSKCEKSLRMRFRAFYGLLNLYEVNHIMEKVGVSDQLTPSRLCYNLLRILRTRSIMVRYRNPRTAITAIHSNIITKCRNVTT